jgi:hypothetical protein
LRLHMRGVPIILIVAVENGVVLMSVSATE